MKLEKKYGQERLVSGCAAAMDARLYSVSDMVDILESGADADYLPGLMPTAMTVRHHPTGTYAVKNILPRA